jgi:hypothetical protein
MSPISLRWRLVGDVAGTRWSDRADSQLIPAWGSRWPSNRETRPEPPRKSGPGAVHHAAQATLQQAQTTPTSTDLQDLNNVKRDLQAMA